MTLPSMPLVRLTIARAIAWSLLLAGWVGLGSVALVLAQSVLEAFALVALWLFALGVAATVATHDSLRAWIRRSALILCSAVTAVALAATTRGGGLTALLVALFAWASLTALASGVVRRLRLAQATPPRPPVVAASLGALCAGLVLADVGDLGALTLRLAVLVLVAAALLAALHIRDMVPSQSSRCRAGLFDCSLPAWPAGAWNDARQWPALLAGLAMLPMMAMLPLVVEWCRSRAVSPELMVMLHFAAMFAPALLVRRSIGKWSVSRLSTVCMLCLALGSVLAVAVAAPFNLLGLAFAHGTAWGLAWAGQLWAPNRRSRNGTSPLRAATGYAMLTLSFGAVVAQFGAAGVTVTHTALGIAAVLAWIFGRSLGPDATEVADRRPPLPEIDSGSPSARWPIR
jgi:hypothetical protein